MNLTVEEICRIIKVCSECGVSQFSFGGCEIRIGISAEEIKKSKPMTPEQEKEFLAQEQKSLVQDEYRARKMQYSELLITDPLAAEEMLLEDSDITGDDESDGPRE